MIEITISNMMVMKGLPPSYKKHFKKTLTLDNPLYYKLMHASDNRAKAFYGTPQYFTYYKEHGDSFIVPRGMRNRIITFLNKVNADYSIKESFVCKQLRKYS